MSAYKTHILIFLEKKTHLCLGHKLSFLEKAALALYFIQSSSMNSFSKKIISSLVMRNSLSRHLRKVDLAFLFDRVLAIQTIRLNKSLRKSKNPTEAIICSVLFLHKKTRTKAGSLFDIYESSISTSLMKT